MGNNKIIKSAAAVALTASVVATAAAPQASAAAYKVNKKDQLVSSSTGKLVKGWKVFGGKLYKNGKLAPAKKYKIIGKGAAQRLYYGPTLKKGYKTANSKTLLFKDGKLADGWKQAGKNERLYKNGKLDKGYTVYTNVEGDKFLYLNGKLKKGDKTATRAGETLLFTDGLLSKGLKEFKGKTYYNGKVANGTIEGKEYDNGVLVTDIASVKAINATTVEVTFKTSKADVKAADFTIEGLEVKNAAVKQSDSKVVVLTTAPQEANKEYTVKYGDSTKTFTGVSAVIPTSVTFSNPSQQAVIGNQVTVEASVTVAEGQSKAGIPVTFNISRGGNNDAGEVVEAITDENGVAKYTYTKYTEGNDNVVAYATGDASKRTQVGKVYWGKQARLAVSEVTTGNTIANDGKKVYKVAAPELANKYVFVAFKENVNVTPDKITTGVKVVDTANKLSGSSAYPYEVTTGGKQYVAFKLDAKGEANFTLQGTEATVTPIVFSDAQFNNDLDKNGDVVGTSEGKLDATELQASAPSVTFLKAFTNQLEVTANGEQKAAAVKTIGDITANSTNIATTPNVGGRTYTVVVKDKDGKLAPEGTKAYVTFKKDAVSADKLVYIQGKDNKAVLAYNKNTKEYGQVEVEVKGKEGKATFTVVGEKDAFATPTVFLDNGQGKDAVTGLDDSDLQVTGETTYFVDEVVANATLTSSAAPSNKLLATETATFTYKAVDQNGKPYETKEFTPTFQVSATNSDVVVTKEDGTLVVTGDLAASTVKAGQTKTFTLDKAKDKSVIKVTPATATAADVTVTASTTDSALPVKTASVSFTKVVTAVENAVAKINEAKGYANDKDLYNTVVGEEIVTPSNLAAVKDAVGVAYTNNGADLTAEQIASTVKEAVKAKATADAKVAAENAVAKAETNPTQANVDDAQTAVDAAKAAGNDTTALQAKVDAVQITVNENTGKAVAFGTTETQALTNAGTVWTDLATQLAKTTAEVKQTATTLKVKGTGTLAQSTAYPTVDADGELYVGFNVTAPTGVNATSYELGNGNSSNTDATNQAYITLAFTKTKLAQAAADKNTTLVVKWKDASGAVISTVNYTVDYSELTVAAQ